MITTSFLINRIRLSKCSRRLLKERYVNTVFTYSVFFKSSHWRCSVKKGVVRNFAKFTGNHLCQSLFIKKEILAQVFSCEFCEISKNTFSYRTLPVAASGGTFPRFKILIFWILIENFSLSLCASLDLFSGPKK